MTTTPDPWAGTDHDPTSHAEVARQQALIHTARHAATARLYAAAMLLALFDTDDARRLAHYYLPEAHLLPPTA